MHIKPEAAELLAERLREREFAAYGLPLNLQVLGYVENCVLDGIWLHFGGTVLYLAGLLGKVTILAGVGAVAALLGMYRFFSRKRRWRWIGTDGANRLEFVARGESIQWWMHFCMTPSNQQVWDDFLRMPIVDPHLGELQCNLRLGEGSAWQGQDLVFRIQPKPSQIPKKLGKESLKAWKGTHRVLADPRLHPDTVEALVERFVLSGSEAAKRNYMINRHFEQMSHDAGGG